jgi:hypothetical protein
MLDWIRDVFSGLALCVSALSLYISWRTAQKSNVSAWVDIVPAQEREWHLATLTVKNPSHLDIAVKKVGISLPDFRLADMNDVLVDDGYGNRVLPATIKFNPQSLLLSFDSLTVAAGGTTTKQFLIFQPAHSAKKMAIVTVAYSTKEPKPKWRSLPVRVVTRSSL